MIKGYFLNKYISIFLTYGFQYDTVHSSASVKGGSECFTVSDNFWFKFRKAITHVANNFE